MDLSSDSPNDPPGSSPPTTDSQDLGELPNRAPSPTQSPLNLQNQPRTFNFGWELSSDPLGAQENSSSDSAAIHRLQSRKRGPSLANPFNRPTKEPRTSTQQNSPANSTNSAQDLILNARDLLVQAYSASKSRLEQAKLLDLLEIFREYTEKGVIQKTSSILATQVANLEQASRKIENQTRQNSTWAKIAQIQPDKNSISLVNQPIQLNQPNLPANKENWTLVTSKKGSSIGASTSTSSNTREKTSSKTRGPSKPALSRRCTLLQAHRVQASLFSAFRVRNLINTAFQAKGIQKPVISGVSLSAKGNIVVYTTSDFNSDFLIEKEAIIKGVLPLVTSLQKGEPWYKVVIHGLPIQDFNSPDGMDLVVSEIEIFNKGLTPIGKPYWITSKENRSIGQLLGSIAVAFPTESQANQAIQNRLYIAGISAKVTKYRSINSSIQCKNCGGFGHLDKSCKKDPKCILCAEPHLYIEHFCSICKKKGQTCTHLTPKCVNCNSTTHSANSKLCEVYLAVKNRTQKATSIPIIIDEL